MKKRNINKLALSRETLHRLEDRRLRNVSGGTGGRPTDQESVCWCWTDLCVSAGYTGCVECES